MRAIVVFESMYGNTHHVANAIAAGLADSYEVSVLPVGDATEEVLRGTDLLVVGGPTHVHGMSRESTRRGAMEAAEKPGAVVEMDPDAEGDGLREWFDELAVHRTARGIVAGLGWAAAFDTRYHLPPALTGRASKGIAKRLEHHGYDLVGEPRSFFVTRDSATLEPGEEAEARAWGHELAVLVRAQRPADPVPAASPTS